MPATGSVLHENSMNTENPATNRPTMRAVCTVSAAALMLGASQAATVGLHFQPDWSITIHRLSSNGDCLWSRPRKLAKPDTFADWV